MRCEFTNVRNTAPLTLTKEWGDAFVGNEVELSAAGDDVLSNGPVGSTSVAPTNGPATSALTVYSDETVTVSETFGPGDIANYNIALVCTGGQTIDTTNVTINGQTASYELVFGDDPQPTACRFQNTIKTTTVVLQKEWIDGRLGDQSALTITSGTSPATDTATSTATGATGAEVDTTNQAVLTNVFVGDVLTSTKPCSSVTATTRTTSSATADRSTTTTSTTRGRSRSSTPTRTTRSRARSPTRRTATLELTKDWADSPHQRWGRAADRPGRRPARLHDDHVERRLAAPISTVVYVGDTYEIAEDALATFGAANYDIDWVCTDAAGSSGSDETTGSVAITPADADATILCTFTNDRLSTPLSFRKEWIDGAEGDTADLTIDPEIVDPATATWAVPVDADPVGTGSGTTTDSYTVTVAAGEDVVLSEVLADSNLGGYTVADFDCGAVIPAVGSGTWTVSVDETNTDSAIECVITNERTETTLTLVKDWVDPTTGLGSSVEMTATGQAGEITESSTSPTDSISDTLRVFSGETVDTWRCSPPAMVRTSAPC
ncbi:MAG: hypothetical protein R2697_18560 [Ilumatobacteraceae bacterium]